MCLDRGRTQTNYDLRFSSMSFGGNFFFSRIYFLFWVKNFRKNAQFFFSSHFFLFLTITCERKVWSVSLWWKARKVNLRFSKKSWRFTSKKKTPKRFTTLQFPFTRFFFFRTSFSRCERKFAKRNLSTLTHFSHMNFLGYRNYVCWNKFPIH